MYIHVYSPNNYVNNIIELQPQSGIIYIHVYYCLKT